MSDTSTDSAQNPRPLERPGFRTGLKIAVIALILLLLLIPLRLVESVVSERQERSRAVTAETIGTHGGEQRLTAAFVVIPVTVTGENDEGRVYEWTEQVYVPASDLAIDVTLAPETLVRGIYHVPVYTAGIHLAGTVVVPDDLSFDRSTDATFRFDEAQLAIGISNPTALRQRPTGSWDDTSPAPVAAALDPQLNAAAIAAGSTPGGRGIAFAATGVAPGSRHTFSVNLTLSGGGSFTVLPVAMDADISAASTWVSPSFGGHILPTERFLSDEGFTATWNVSGLGQGLTDAFTGYHRISTGADLRIGLFVPVDHYQKATRSVKYGALFLLLPFVALFLIEVFGRTRLHPIQYLLVGAAKVVFYLLELSLSEQLGFTPAYAIGAVATVLLVVTYARSALHSMARAMVLAGLLVGEYVFLYTALASEDYALLIGSIGLFVLLGVVMLTTRRVDWYAATSRAAGAPTSTRRTGGRSADRSGEEID